MAGNSGLKISNNYVASNIASSHQPEPVTCHDLKHLDVASALEADLTNVTSERSHEADLKEDHEATHLGSLHDLSEMESI